MAKQWKISAPAPPEFQDQFPELPGVVAQLLYNRGLTEPEKVERFLSPEYHHLHNPFLFQDMQKAVENILHLCAIWEERA
jgi:single-stranded-DNA-specific exonuclease